MHIQYIYTNIHFLYEVVWYIQEFQSTELKIRSAYRVFTVTDFLHCMDTCYLLLHMYGYNGQNNATFDLFEINVYI